MLLITIGIIIFPKPIDYNEYLAAHIDKVKLLKAAKSPKVILVGGSDIAFSFDAQYLKKELDYPVINMGLFAGLGMRFMLDEVREYLSAGDIVIIIPEYEQFYKWLNGSGSELLDLYILSKDSRKHISSWGQFMMIIRYFPDFIKYRIINYTEYFLSACSDKFPDSPFFKKHKQLFFNSIYRRSSLNSSGSIREDLIENSKDIINPEDIGGKFNNDSIDVLNEFLIYAADHNTKVFLLMPFVLNSWYEKNRQSIEYAYFRLKNGTIVPLLNRPYDAIMPKDYFFDTQYHLNAKGRKAGSEKAVLLFKKITKNDL